MELRIEKIRKILDDKKIDAILIKSQSNKFYIGALTGSGVKVLITRNMCYQIMDGRYINEAEKNTTGYKNIVHAQGGNYIEVIKEIIGDKSILGVESNHTLVKEYLDIKKSGLEIYLLNDELERTRECKDKLEIQLIKEACKITDDVFKEAIKKIKIGMTELQLSALIQYISLSKGATKMAFDTIIASGDRGAMPHGRPTNKTFKENEFITIDFGIVYKGYQSDMTRTICIGEPNEELKRIYNVVLEAQKAGVEYIREGRKCSDIDKYVRDIITKAGYGNYFTHGLGHGMGIGDGEFPILNSRSNTILKEGMVMSCEPGVYIPNVGGVRIEDDVVIENGKGVAINNTPKDLIILEGR